MVYETIELPADYKKYKLQNAYFRAYSSIMNWLVDWKISVKHPMICMYGIVHLWEIKREFAKTAWIYTNKLLDEDCCAYNVYYDKNMGKYYIVQEKNNGTYPAQILLSTYKDVLQYMWLYVGGKSSFIIGIKEQQMLVDGVGYRKVVGDLDECGCVGHDLVI